MSAESALAPELTDGGKPRSGFRHALAEGRRLVGLVYRDPEHVTARLTLYGSERLADPSREWAARVQAERPEVSRAVIAEELRTQTAQVARVDGAVAGTPFLIALLPGYLAYLWQEGVMERRIAALYGSDPADLATAAQILVLRGVYPNAEAARAALVEVRDAPPPGKPTTRRPVRVWLQSIVALLIYGGFVSARSSIVKEGHWKLKALIGLLLGIGVFVITWVLPVTFMIAMAWGCESHARSLGHATMTHYGGVDTISEAQSGSDDEPGRTRRDVLRGGLLALSIAVPIGFIAYADHVRQSTGINWLGALGALVAASMVIATTVLVRRR